MKILSKVLMLSVGLWLTCQTLSCQSNNTIGKLVVACDSTAQYKLVGNIQGIKGEVVKLPKLFPSSSFFIKVTSSLSDKGYMSLPLDVCNLPETYKVEGLKISFSGKLFWYNSSDQVSIDASTQPFELSEISKIDY